MEEEEDRKDPIDRIMMKKLYSYRATRLYPICKWDAQYYTPKE